MKISLFYPFCINKADKFAVSYTYETGATPQYGGNISGATWKHADGTMKTDGLRGLGAKIYLEKIPISSQTFAMAEEIDMDVVTAAMNGGDDYKFLFVIPLGQHETFRKEFHDFEVIGHLAQPDVGPVLVTPEGAELPIYAQGY